MLQKPGKPPRRNYIHGAVLNTDRSEKSTSRDIEEELSATCPGRGQKNAVLSLGPFATGGNHIIAMYV